MKTLIFLLFLSAVSVSWGQTVVDHTTKFPPIRGQQSIPDCGLFSFIYYLGTYELCQKYGLDPKDKKNQLNHNFVWNQMANTSTGGSPGAYEGSLFMEQFGCATVADMAVDEQDPERLPSLKARENALRYRAKPAIEFGIGRRGLPTDMEDLQASLEVLKDSLRQGVCFSMGIRLFPHYYSMTPENPVYGCDSMINEQQWTNSHYVCVVGYNDTVKTPEGRGALIVLDPSDNNAGGRWYYDYNWFFIYKEIGNACYFFQEDFRPADPELVLNLDLSGMISGDEIMRRKYCFVDQIFESQVSESKWIDYDWESYLMFSRLVQIQKINGQHPEKSAGDLKYLPTDNKVILLPMNNHDGHRRLLTDLTDYISAPDFQSLEILIQDPVSSEYIGQDGQVLYSYEREPATWLNEGFIKYPGTDKRIYGKVVNLPDTTVVCKNFYSYPISFFLTPVQYEIYISKCTSVIRRFLITFDVADIVSASSVEDPYRSGNLSLGQNYPNPVVNMTTISFSLVDHTPVSLKVYDLTGREVETLVSSDLLPGEHQINFDASRLSPGIYMYALRTRDGLETRRMMKK